MANIYRSIEVVGRYLPFNKDLIYKFYISYSYISYIYKRSKLTCLVIFFFIFFIFKKLEEKREKKLCVAKEIKTKGSA